MSFYILNICLLEIIDYCKEKIHANLGFHSLAVFKRVTCFSASID